MTLLSGASASRLSQAHLSSLGSMVTPPFLPLPAMAPSDPVLLATPKDPSRSFWMVAEILPSPSGHFRTEDGSRQGPVVWVVRRGVGLKDPD